MCMNRCTCRWQHISLREIRPKVDNQRYWKWSHYDLVKEYKVTYIYKTFPDW